MTDFVTRLEWAAASDLVRDAQNIILVTHVRPDGDAIGSLCGLGLALRNRQKTATLVVDEGITPYLSFVPGSQTVLAALPANPQADLVISLDASDPQRLGIAGQQAIATGAPVVVVDHHVTNTFFGAAHIVNERYVSTTEAVLRWLDYLGWRLTPDIAKALLIGMVTDTISFRVGPVSGETLHQVARLIAHDINLREVIEKMLVTLEPGRLEMMGVGLARMVIEAGVAYTYLAEEDFTTRGLTESEKPELATEMLRDARVMVAAQFTAAEDGLYRVSLRAVPGFAVGPIALELGGGGHTQAAGATLQAKSMEDAIAQVLPKLKAEAARGTPLYS
ncbi:MAG: DHH family phosphoesterase [Anaerolineales bacterium]